jgi:carbonyl reductase 1
MAAAPVRRILVTGANKGIGLAIVNRCLADHVDTYCILACRSQSRADAAVASLVADNPSWRGRMEVLEMDTGSDTSVAAAAATLSKRHGTSPAPLYGIVNNAGIAAAAFEDILNVNVWGPRRVDTALIPLLDPKIGRIVVVASGVGPMTVSKCSAERKAFFVNQSVTWDQIEALMAEMLAYPGGKKDLEAHGIGSGMGGYGVSKALANSYMMCCARENPNLLVNSCSPGLIATDLFTDFLPFFIPSFIGRFLVQKLMPRLMGAKTTDEGSVSTLHLLFSPDVGTGRYYGSDAKRSPLDVYRSAGSPPYEP